MNTERERVFSEMESKYGIDMKGKTPIGELPNIMTKVDWMLVSCFLKYPNGIPKDKRQVLILRLKAIELSC
jgi:hypothetical protein